MSSEPLEMRRRGLGGGLASGIPPVPQKPKSLDMRGAYPLTKEEVAKHRSSLYLHGNYAFGHLNEKGEFVVSYVGRFDKGGNRINHGVGRYTHFKISYAATEKEAVEKECRNYHDFTPPDNQIHPACPSGMCCPLGCS